MKSIAVPEHLRNCDSKKYVLVTCPGFEGVYSSDDFLLLGDRRDARDIGSSAVELLRVENMLYPLVGSSGRLPREAILAIIRRDKNIQ
jgi:hypothetical protein